MPVCDDGTGVLFSSHVPFTVPSLKVGWELPVEEFIECLSKVRNLWLNVTRMHVMYLFWARYPFDMN